MIAYRLKDNKTFQNITCKVNYANIISQRKHESASSRLVGCGNSMRSNFNFCLNFFQDIFGVRKTIPIHPRKRTISHVQISKQVFFSK
jgi:hypothetical protein